MKHLSLALIFSVMMVVTGCRGPAGPAPRPGALQPYSGPTETMAEVVEAINANNAALPTLYAKLEFEADIKDQRGRGTFANGDGTLLYKAPRGMRLVGSKPFATLFEIGSTEDRYWVTMWPPNARSTMTWGEYRNLGKPCVDVTNVPIRPDLVLEVLGVGTVNTNFLEPPAPTMRFNNVVRLDAAGGEVGAYMFVWNVPAGDRWVAQREIWYDRVTKLPWRVSLYDVNGRAVVQARLSGHEPVELPDVPAGRWPRVARQYELFFPDTGSRMTFRLFDVAPERRGVPTRRGISFPQDPKVDEVIQLDEACVD